MLRPSQTRWIVLSASTFVTLATAWACGLEFPAPLLEDRLGVLQSTPGGGYWADLGQLAPRPNDAWTARSDDTVSDVIEAEELELPPEAYLQVSHMRAAESGEAAYALGRGLPESVRLYTAGAVDFHNASLVLPPEHVSGHRMFSDTLDENGAVLPAGAGPTRNGRSATRQPEQTEINRAIARFEAVLALPEAEARDRATWAAYTLGRALALRNRPRDLDLAARAFGRVRELVQAGAPDRLGLAVASLGEEARIRLKLEQVPAAIELYAQQAMAGSASAWDSLYIVAESLFDDPARLAANISDHRVQRLLVGYALSVNSGGTGFTPDLQLWNVLEARPEEADDENDMEDSEDVDKAAESDVADSPDPTLVLLQAIDSAGLENVADLDQLAVLRYSIGQFDLAAALVARSNTPLANWLKAKLALRSGNLDKAAAYYAAAVSAMPPPDSPQFDPGSDRERAMGEWGVLALARGEYSEALRHLYEACDDGHGCYSSDVAYLAERVLTLEELMAFVDKYAVPPAKDSSQGDASDSEATPDEDLEEDDWESPSFERDLHHILARRLMRAGRYTEAGHYFSYVDAQSTDDEPKLRDLANQYADARHVAEGAWTSVGRARGWFTAAEIARRHGMELFGYEGEPDVAEWDGAYYYSSLPKLEDGPLVTDGELQRVSATTPPLPVRFHYRRVAVEHAERAADLLPPRSQAYAAVLCTAAGWMRDGPSVEGNGGRELALYRRYVDHGAYVPWARNFGRRCAAPDFDAASRLLWEQRKSAARIAFRQHRWTLAGAALILAGLSGWAVVSLRRRRDRAGSMAA